MTRRLPWWRRWGRKARRRLRSQWNTWLRSGMVRALRTFLTTSTLGTGVAAPLNVGTVKVAAIAAAGAFGSVILRYLDTLDAVPTPPAD